MPAINLAALRGNGVANRMVRDPEGQRLLVIHLQLKTALEAVQCATQVHGTAAEID